MVPMSDKRRIADLERRYPRDLFKRRVIAQILLGSFHFIPQMHLARLASTEQIYDCFNVSGI
jgi:hypothetical protein